MPNSGTEQTERRDAIRQLLGMNAVETQQDLVRELSARGLAVTQSSVSRDLKDLGAIKTGSGYELPDAGRDGDQEMAAVANLIRKRKTAGANLLVVKTAIGAAQRVRSEERRVGKECRSRWSPYH